MVNIISTIEKTIVERTILFKYYYNNDIDSSNTSSSFSSSSNSSHLHLPPQVPLSSPHLQFFFTSAFKKPNRNEKQ